jgi:CheY-like chemotaxis protein
MAGRERAPAYNRAQRSDEKQIVGYFLIDKGFGSRRGGQRIPKGHMKHVAEIFCGTDDGKRHAAPASESNSAKSFWRPLNIVIADDEPDTATTLKAILEDEGHKVQAVFRPEEVIPAVRRFMPDAVILDIAMPNISGYELAKQIRQRFMTYRPLLIAISGVYRKGPDAFLSMAVGFDHHLAKPANPDEILELLASLMRAPRR